MSKIDTDLLSWCLHSTGEKGRQTSKQIKISAKDTCSKEAKQDNIINGVIGHGRLLSRSGI